MTGKKVLTLKSKGSPYVTAKNDGAPLLATRSAIGVLKYATEEESPRVAFLDESEVRQLMTMHRAGPCADNFYILDPRKYRSSEYQQKKDPRRQRETEQDIGDYLDRTGGFDRSHATLFPRLSRLTHTQLRLEQSLSNARRFMLVAMSPTPPADAYTSVRRGDTWYSILDSDAISKRTLALINQFNTIQAIPSAAPLTPTISVGAR